MGLSEIYQKGKKILGEEEFGHDHADSGVNG